GPCGPRAPPPGGGGAFPRDAPAAGAPRERGGAPRAVPPPPPLELVLEPAARIGRQVQLVHGQEMLPPRPTSETGSGGNDHAFRKKIWNSMSPWSSMLATTGDDGAWIP